MTRLVVDASVLIRALVGPGTAAARARTFLDGADLHAPELLDLEVASALRRLERSRALAPDLAAHALALAAAAPVTRHGHRPLLARSWQLRHNLTPYDASYVALAELLDATLLTADTGLATAPGPRCARTLVA